MLVDKKIVFLICFSIFISTASATAIVNSGTQQDWNKGRFNGTSADRQDNSGILGIGYMNTSDTSIEGFWRFDRTNGEPTDYSGNGNTGKTYGSINRGVDGTFSTPSFDFDGTDDLVSFPEIGDGTVFDGSSGFTIAAWVRFNEVGNGRQRIVNPQKNADVEFSELGDSTVSLRVWDGDNAHTAPASVQANRWIHLVGVYNISGGSDQIYTYVNGSLRASSSVSDPVDQTRNNSIGARQDSDGSTFQHLNGSVDEVQIYSSALTSKEIRELYHWGRDFVGEYNHTGISIPSSESLSKLEVNYSNVDSTGGNGNSSTFRLEHSGGETQNIQLDAANSGTGPTNFSLSFSNTGGTVDVLYNTTADTPVLSPLVEEYTLYSSSGGGGDSAPSVTLNEPSHGSTFSGHQTVTFNATSTDDFDVDNATLYSNFTGAWQPNETAQYTGTTAKKTEIWNKPLDPGYYIWNVKAVDNASQSSFASSNFSLTVESTVPTVNSPAGSPDPVEAGSVVNVTVNVTDSDGDLQFVNVSLTDPTGTLQADNASMSGPSGDTYWYGYTVPASSDSLGSWDMEVYATDSSGNQDLNSSTFTSEDTTSPLWRSLADDAAGGVLTKETLTIDVESQDNVSGVEEIFLSTNETNSWKNYTSYDTSLTESRTYEAFNDTGTLGTGWSENGSWFYDVTQVDEGVFSFPLYLYQRWVPDPWNISSISEDPTTGLKEYTHRISTSADGGIEFQPNGSRMYTTRSGTEIAHFWLSDPWNTSSSSITTTAYTLGAFSWDAKDITLSPDGSIMHVLGTNDSDEVNFSVAQFTLSKPWNISNQSRSLNAYVKLYPDKQSRPRGMDWNPSGQELTIINYSTVSSARPTVYETNEAYNISGITVKDVPTIPENPVSAETFTWSANGSMYQIGTAAPYENGTAVYQYETDGRGNEFWNKSDTWLKNSIAWENTSFSNDLYYRLWLSDGRQNWIRTDRMMISINDLPSLKNVTVSVDNIGASASQTVTIGHNDPDGNEIRNATTPPSGTLTTGNATSTITGWASPFNYLFNLWDFYEPGDINRDINATYTEHYIYAENNSGTFNETRQTLNSSITLDIRGDPANLSVGAANPDATKKVVRNDNLTTTSAATGTHDKIWYWYVDHIESTIYGEYEDASQSHSLGTQYIARKKQIYNNNTPAFSSLTVDPPTISGTCTNCNSRTISLGGTTRTNETYNASGDFLSETESTYLAAQNTTKQSNTSTQFLYNQTNLSITNSKSFSFQSVDLSSTCSITTSATAPSGTNELTQTCNNQSYQVDHIQNETNYTTTPQPDEVTLGVNFLANQPLQLNETGGYDWTGIDTSAEVWTPTGCSQNNNTKVDLNASTSTNYTVELQCAPGDEGNPDLDKIDLPNNDTQYWYNTTTATINTNITEETRIVWKIDESELTDWDARNTQTEVAYANGNSTNISVEDAPNFVYVSIGSEHGNSSLHEGSHDLSLGYKVKDENVTSNDGSTGGTGGAPGAGDDQGDGENDIIFDQNRTYSVPYGSTREYRFAIINTLNRKVDVTVTELTEQYPGCQYIDIQKSFTSTEFGDQAVYTLNESIEGFTGAGFKRLPLVRIELPPKPNVTSLDDGLVTCGYTATSTRGAVENLLISVKPEEGFWDRVNALIDRLLGVKAFRWNRQCFGVSILDNENELCEDGQEFVYPHPTAAGAVMLAIAAATIVGIASIRR